MSRQIEEIPLVNLKLDHSSGVPLYKQLYNLIRNGILEGKFAKGLRLPGTRSLAAELKVSRNTCALAFEQLIIEGYLNGKVGAGVFVNEIPDYIPSKFKTSIQKEKISYEELNSLPSKRDNILIAMNKNLGSSDLIKRFKSADEIIPFQNGISALDEFPFKIWQKLIIQAAQNFPVLPLGYGDAAGYKPLREAIASYLRTYRAVNCKADQIIILNGTQQGLDLIGRVLLQHGPKRRIVWVEDPGYFCAKASMIFAGAQICPSPLDEEGLDLNYCSRNYPKPDLIFTTPSHQFPMGMTMSISRRLNLLQFAKANQCWIIEDDYDSEFRYSGDPLPSLQGLVQDNRILYMGTFSKVLFPALRIGYLVLPDPELFETFASVKSLVDRQHPIFDQFVLTRFIEEGHFTRHIRKMRMLYKKRQEFLIDEINKDLDGILNVAPDPAGMHIIGWLPENSDDKKIAAEAIKNKVLVRALSEYSIKFFKNPGLMIGYAAFSESQIRRGWNILKKVLNNFYNR